MNKVGSPDHRRSIKAAQLPAVRPSPAGLPSTGEIRHVEGREEKKEEEERLVSNASASPRAGSEQQQQQQQQRVSEIQERAQPAGAHSMAPAARQRGASTRPRAYSAPFVPYPPPYPMAHVPIPSEDRESLFWDAVSVSPESPPYYGAGSPLMETAAGVFPTAYHAVPLPFWSMVPPPQRVHSPMPYTPPYSPGGTSQAPVGVYLPTQSYVDASDPRLVWVSGLDLDTTDEHSLIKAFTWTGSIRCVGLVRDATATGGGGGIAWILMNDLEDAIKSLEMDGASLAGSKISVCLPNISDHVKSSLESGAAPAACTSPMEMDTESSRPVSPSAMTSELEINNASSVVRFERDPSAETEVHMLPASGTLTNVRKQTNGIVHISVKTMDPDLGSALIGYLLTELEQTLSVAAPPSVSKGKPFLAASMDDFQMYKTRLCNSWLRFEEQQQHQRDPASRSTGMFVCPRGEDCPYAHGPNELRRNPLFKTRVCEMFWKTGDCKYTMKGRGGCHFAHSLEELRPELV